MNKLPSEFIKTAKLCGIEHLAKSKGHFYVEKNKVLSSAYPQGISMQSQETQNGVQTTMVVEKNVKIAEPLFFCFGLLGQDDRQTIGTNIVVQDGASVKVVAHCSFPHAKQAEHNMTASFQIGKNAKLEYEEHHYHGENSGATVTPKMIVKVDEAGQYQSNFILSQGTVGKTKIELEVTLEKEAKAYIETKVMGKSQQDRVEIFDKVILNGEGSKSLIKMRAAAKNGGQVLMQGETYANAAGAVGHVDCQEIVVGKTSVAKAIPVVEVSDENARVTHEASVGKINQKELETLMTRGLDEDAATEMIIEAMMR